MAHHAALSRDRGRRGGPPPTPATLTNTARTSPAPATSPAEPARDACSSRPTKTCSRVEKRTMRNILIHQLEHQTGRRVVSSSASAFSLAHANTARALIMRSGMMLCVLLAAACHQADALRVAPPVTRRALLSLAAATSLASTPAFAQQAKQAEQAAPAVVARPLCRYSRPIWPAQRGPRACRGSPKLWAARGMIWR